MRFGGDVNYYNVVDSDDRADYWWLRSLSTNNGGYSWYVDPEGDVGDYYGGVWYSYGQICTTLRTSVILMIYIS